MCLQVPRPDVSKSRQVQLLRSSFKSRISTGVAPARGRCGLEVPEMLEVRLQPPELAELRPTPPPAALDLLGVRSAPTQKYRWLEFLVSGRLFPFSTPVTAFSKDLPFLLRESSEEQ